MSAFRSGDMVAARALLEEGLKAHADDPQYRNAVGDLLLKMGDAVAAVEHFGSAAKAAPGNADFSINYAIALTATRQNRTALSRLIAIERIAQTRAVYWSTRGNAARGVGDLAEAERSYDRALAIEPGRVRALHGRARIAIERGSDDAVARFDRALAANRADADLWLGKAQALDVASDSAGARQIAEALLEQAPAWDEALKFLAQLRSAAGEQDFTSHYKMSMNRIPQDPNIPSAWCAILAGSDRDAEAAEVAAAARRAFPDEPYFAYLEAVHASTAGEWDRADAIYRTLAKDDPDRWLQEARHRIRDDDPEAADALLDRLLQTEPWSISAWAIRGVAWRMMNDKRAEWLYENVANARMVPLTDAEFILPELRPLLHDLHDRSPFPLGQSLRGGTQTRGGLFDRANPILARLQSAIMTSVEGYRRSLPPADPDHPFLRARNHSWTMAGSWSVRLAGGGDHHTSHIHPQGIVSSALYVDLPNTICDDGRAGWLEIGRPAKDLRTNLPPLVTLQPQEGQLALFPSIMYHGTRPFDGGAEKTQRMTVAFDINLKDATE